MVFGAGYDKVALLLKILAFIILAIGINNVTGMQYLIPTGRQNLFTITVLIGAGVNFCLNLVLIYFFSPQALQLHLSLQRQQLRLCRLYG